MSFARWIMFFGFAAALGFSVLKAQADDGDYIFILNARGNAYWTVMAEGIEDAAKVQGVRAAVYNTDTSTDTEQQLNICQTAVQRQPKALVLAAINPSIAIECFKAAAAHNIAFADVDGSFSVADANKAGLKLAFSVGSDNYAIGQEAAAYAAKIAGKPGPKIFVLEGTVGSMQARKRADGFKDGIRQLLPQAEIVTSIVADFDRLKAMNITSDLLQRQPDLDIIYAANDTMALGAAEAVRNLHREARIKIIGVDGTADARKAIMDGKLTASVAQLPYLMGKRAVELAVAATASHKTGITEITATPVLTKQLIEDGKDPMLQYVR